MRNLRRSAAYDDYWRFAANRHKVYLARLQDKPAPWTTDPIISSYRFTNTYRATDRVSQFLIREVLYDRSNDLTAEDTVFRALLFKVFNNVGTWKALESELGSIRWQSFDFELADQTLERLLQQKRPIYSAAYIMASPPFGAKRKHLNHLRLLSEMMKDGFAREITEAGRLSDIYQAVLRYRGLGSFLAFQYAIDLNYSNLTGFGEDDFVVAGPGAHDGIRKCFPDAQPEQAETIIHWMVENQELEFKRLGIEFDGLFGRELRPIDCQNVFCEISKYCRVAHPTISGVSGRTRIKQVFSQANRASLPPPFFPPKWKIKVPQTHMPKHKVRPNVQLELYN